MSKCYHKMIPKATPGTDPSINAHTILVGALTKRLRMEHHCGLGGIPCRVGPSHKKSPVRNKKKVCGRLRSGGGGGGGFMIFTLFLTASIRGTVKAPMAQV